MKHSSVTPRKKAMAVFLILCLLSFLLPGMAGPNLASAANSSLQLTIGNYRGLSKEVTVPISITNPSGVAALTFKIVPGGIPGNPVKVKSISAGPELPQGSTLDWYIPPDGAYANVGVYIISKGGLTKDMVLANITFTHAEAEGSGPYTLNISTVTAYNEDGGQLAHTSTNGFIDVKIRYGDLNRSETVSVTDALLAMNAVIGNRGLSQALKDAGNVSRASTVMAGGNLTIYDVLLIAQYAAGVIDYFPVNDPSNLAPPPPPPGNAVTPNSLVITAGAGSIRTFSVGFPNNVSGYVKLEVKNVGEAAAECTDIIDNGNEIDIFWNMSGITGDSLIINHITQDQSEISDSLIYHTLCPPVVGTYPVISTTTSIMEGRADPSITVKLGGDEFATAALSGDTSNWNFVAGTTGLRLGAITRNGDTSVTITFTGTADAGTLSLRAKADALVGDLDSNTMEIIVH
jgi:hypothetical protein